MSENPQEPIFVGVSEYEGQKEKIESLGTYFGFSGYGDSKKRKQYAERDIMAQGSYYMRHLSAMTAEKLHSKSDIAAELAHRDMEIDKLRDEIVRLSQIGG